MCGNGNLVGLPRTSERPFRAAYGILRPSTPECRSRAPQTHSVEGGSCILVWSILLILHTSMLMSGLRNADRDSQTEIRSNQRGEIQI